MTLPAPSNGVESNIVAIFAGGIERPRYIVAILAENGGLKRIVSTDYSGSDLKSGSELTEL